MFQLNLEQLEKPHLHTYVVWKGTIIFRTMFSSAG